MVTINNSFAKLILAGSIAGKPVSPLWSSPLYFLDENIRQHLQFSTDFKSLVFTINKSFFFEKKKTKKFLVFTINKSLKEKNCKADGIW